MNYSKIETQETKDHLLKLIDFLYNEMVSSGGDGDALWYSTYYNVEDIKVLVETYNSKLKFPMTIEIRGESLHWGDNQEWIVITNDSEYYHTSPDWIQIKVRY